VLQLNLPGPSETTSSELGGHRQRDTPQETSEEDAPFLIRELAFAQRFVHVAVLAMSYLRLRNDFDVCSCQWQRWKGHTQLMNVAYSYIETI